MRSVLVLGLVLICGALVACKSDKKQAPDKTEKPDKTDKTDKTEKPDKTDKTDTPSTEGARKSHEGMEAKGEPPPDDSAKANQKPKKADPTAMDDTAMKAMDAQDDSWGAVLPSPAEVLAMITNVGGKTPPAVWSAVVGDAKLDLTGDRVLTALRTGAAVTDFFLLALAKDAAKAKPLGDQLLKAAEQLGVGDAVKEQGPALSKALADGKWDKVGDAMNEVYNGIRQQLKTGMADEDTAVLVGAGAWLEGIRLLSTHLKAHYDKDLASGLRQHFVAGYLELRLGKLAGAAAKAPAAVAIAKAMGELKTLMETGRDEVADPAKVEKIHAVCVAARGAM